MSALPAVGRADAAALGTDATRVLYEQYSNRIFAYCVSRLGTREEAEDAMQTTFLNAFRSMQSGVVPRFELAWLFRIADNVCRDGRKAAWRRGRIEATRDLQELQDVLPSPQHADDGLIGISEALESMPERQRQAILLREWQGLSYAEIARELELSNAAVETLIFRARRSLAQALEGRRASGFNLLSLLSAAKSFLQGGAAVKVAATAVAVGGAALVVTVPLGDGPRAAARIESKATPASVASESGRPARPQAATASTERLRETTAQRRAVAPDGYRQAPTAERPSAPAAPAAIGPKGGATPGAPPVVSANAPVSAPPPAASQPINSPPPPALPPVGLPELPALPELPPVPPVPPLPPPALPPLPETPPLNLPELPPLP